MIHQVAKGDLGRTGLLQRAARLRTPHEGAYGSALLGDRRHHPLAGLAGRACHQNRFTEIHSNSKISGARSYCALWSPPPCNTWLAVTMKLSHGIARRRHGEETVTSSPSWRPLDMILRKLFAASIILAACTAFGAT